MSRVDGFQFPDSNYGYWNAHAVWSKPTLKDDFNPLLQNHKNLKQVLINELKILLTKLMRENAIDSVRMVRFWVLIKHMHMRKQNTTITASLDVVQEPRKGQRFPRFRLDDRLCPSASDTCFQTEWGGEMAAPRPYLTGLFNLPRSVDKW